MVCISLRARWRNVRASTRITPLYRGTSLIRHNLLLGPYSRTRSRTPSIALDRGGVAYEGGTPVLHSIVNCAAGKCSRSWRLCLGPPYTGFSLTRKRLPLGLYSKPMPTRVPSRAWDTGASLSLSLSLSMCDSLFALQGLHAREYIVAILDSVRNK